jgi:hypothetical protein
MARLSPSQKMTLLSRMTSPFRDSRGALLVLILLLSGCRKAEVGFNRVPKEKDADFSASASAAGAAVPASAPHPADTPIPAPTAAPGGAMNGTPVAVAAGPGLVWIASVSWQPKPLGTMRKGSFAIVGEAGATADLSITAFPGAVGGELANINRWRGQLALLPIEESDLAGSVTRLNQNGLVITLVDLASASPSNPQRILGAMVPYEGAMWFFKLTGPDALVTTTRPGFVEFLKTVKIAAPDAP